MKRKKKKLKIKHILIIGVIIYIATIFVKQEIEMNRLNSKISMKEKEKTKIINYIDDNLQKAEHLEELDKAEDPLKYIESLENKEQKSEYTNILDYVEKMAREELYMVKPNEIIYIDKGRIDNNFNN